MQVGKTEPKFSILLPTRDRLELARDAIETVRRQSYENWEIVVADNCSVADVAGYVSELGDPRIVYIRSDRFLPVTENWNRAFNASTGQYVVMLGDDDGLTPNYFRRIIDVMRKLGEPDFLYHGAYHFAFPGAMPGVPDGRLTDVTFYHSILRDLPEPRLMDIGSAQMVAKKALDMWAYYGFNMQYFVFSRKFLDKMSMFGPFFQGPFPDFYAANMSMLLADAIGLIAEPMVIIGISPKSYGFHHFNKRETSGVAFLQGDGDPYCGVPPELRAKLLPGTNMLTSWLLSVALIPGHLCDRSDLAVGLDRYRRLQIVHNLRNRALGEPSEASLAELWPRLNWSERFFALGLWLKLLARRVTAGRRHQWAAFADVLAAQHLPLPPGLPPAVDGRYKSIADVYTALASEACNAGRGKA